jgi:hypothetical protein
MLWMKVRSSLHDYADSMSVNVQGVTAHRERHGVDPSRDSGTRSLSTPQFENPPASGWREAHIGFASDGLTLYGLDVWKAQWRPVNRSALDLPHPAYPNQIHSYDIYDIGPINQPIRFAAGELSNGVWGFYLPPNSSVSAFDSADGSLHIEQRFHDPFDDRDEPARSWAVVIDAASRRSLVDCKAWDTSYTVCNSDGSVLLRLQSNGFESLFRIDPAARRFSNIGEAGAEKPLSALAADVERARRLTDERERSPSYRRISADGSLRVDLSSVDWSNSHWVNSPRVIETTTGRIVFDLWYSDWDAVVSFPEAHVVNLDLRRYRGGDSATLSLDFSRNLYRIHSGADHGGAYPSGPIGQAASALRAHSHGSQSSTQRHWGGRVAPDQVIVSPTVEHWNGAAPGKLATMAPWRKATLMLAAALSAIVLIAGVTCATTTPVEQKLDRVPPMPKF